MLAAGLVATGKFQVAVFDILVRHEQGAEAMRLKAERIGAVLCDSPDAAAAGAGLVVSAVTAAAAADVAREAGRYLGAGQILLDINSIAPESKRTNAAAAQAGGAAFVEAAVMAPVHPAGMRVPILLGGGEAESVRAILAPAGMNLEVVSDRIGDASAIKMCRSIMMKGLEALTAECLLAARQYGVEDRIIASVQGSYPGLDYPRLCGYFLERVIQHGRRRAAEMREVAQTVALTGLDPLMADAIARRQDWVADVVARRPDLKALDESRWREALDIIAGEAGLRRLAAPGSTP